jgi:hypothetical protein
MKHLFLLDALPALAAELDAAGAVLSGESALHVHLAAATGSVPGEPPKYAALAPGVIEAVFPEDARDIAGVKRATGAVAELLSGRLDLYSTRVRLADGTVVPTLTREAVLATLLARGGLAIGIAGKLLMVAPEPAVDVDVVREILKASRLGDRFQPLLELLNVA